jgi:hypothetical protein
MRGSDRCPGAEVVRSHSSIDALEHATAVPREAAATTGASMGSRFMMPIAFVHVFQWSEEWFVDRELLHAALPQTRS